MVERGKVQKSFQCYHPSVFVSRKEGTWLHRRAALNHEYIQLFYDGGRYHTETKPLICSANQWFLHYNVLRHERVKGQGNDETKRLSTKNNCAAVIVPHNLPNKLRPWTYV